VILKNNTTTSSLFERDQMHDDMGVFSTKTVDIVIPFYNESGNVIQTHKNAEKLESLFNIKNYVYVNNGSIDKTFDELKWIEQKHTKIKIINIKENIGYGNGFKKGFESSTADFIITNHADQQFDAYGFFSGISDYLSKMNEGSSIFPIRKGRPQAAVFFTTILRQILSIKLGKKLKDFNGQPKLIDRSSISVPINTFPDNFSFDLMLYVFSHEKQFFPIFERPRKFGESSWNYGLISKFHLFKSYLRSATEIVTIIRQSKDD